MRLVSLKVVGYRQFFEESVLEIPTGLIGICGPNGVGKSKLIEAIGYALYGPASAILPRTDHVADLPSKAGKSTPHVELVVEVHGQRYAITRSTSGRASLQILGGTDPIADGASAVTQKVTELLRLNAQAFCGTFVARQNEILGLQSLGASRRRQVVNRLIGITQVEHALTLAKQTIKPRNDNLTGAKADLRMSSADAQEQLCTRQGESEEAIRLQLDQRQKLSRLDRELEEAREKKNAIVRRQEQAATYQQVLTQVVVDEGSATHRLQLTMDRLERAQAAARILVAANTTLQQTADMPAQLSQYDQIAGCKNLIDRRQKLLERFDQEIKPLITERTALEAKIEEIDTRIGELDLKIDADNASATQAEAEANLIAQEVEQIEERRNNVVLLGAEGICAVCGQTLGESYQRVLDGYIAQLETNRQRHQAALTRMRTARLAAAEKHQERQKQKSQKEEVSNRVAQIDSQEQDLQNELNDISEQIAQFPQDISESFYDVMVHNELRLLMQKREAATATVMENQAVASQEDEAIEEVELVKKEILSLQNRQSELTSLITTALPSEVEVEESAQAFADLQAAFNQATERLRDLDSAVATAKEHVRQCNDALLQARQQEEKIARLEREVFVAEQTEQVLQRLLVEIMAEARPRIVELMETWMRALLGRRFRSIQLTEDYQLIADNGSGAHLIGHFSGGEQTLLAIMLRVAISLFCRERAGFETSFLVLDEVFGNQDADRRQQLVDFLNEVKVHYHQILIVNHIEDVTTMLDRIIDVMPVGDNMSKAKVR